MNTRQHALLARQLIAMCGGLEEAARICRLRRSRLAEFQDPGSGAFMPVDVVADLEAYGGDPIYSRALVADRPSAVSSAGAVQEACETAEDASGLQRVIRQAFQDGRITAREHQAIEGHILGLEGELRELRAAVDRGTP